MKTLMILGFLAAFSASAAETDTVQIASRGIGQPVVVLDGVSRNLNQAVVYENGLMQVVVQNGLVESKRLSSFAFNQVQRLSQQLANTEIKTVIFHAICKMMPILPLKTLAVAPFDMSTGRFSGEVRTVLGPEGCFVSRRVFPANEQDLAAARQLKNLLEILAAEIATPVALDAQSF